MSEMPATGAALSEPLASGSVVVGARPDREAGGAVTDRDAELAATRGHILQMAAERTRLQAVILLDLGSPDGRIAVIAQSGLRTKHVLTAAPADLELLDAEGVPVSAALSPGAGSISRLLREEGLGTALAVGLRRHGVDQVLIAARAGGRIARPAALRLLQVAGVLAGVEKERRLALLAERRLRQEAAVAALGRSALSNQDLPGLAQAACDAAAATLEADWIAVLERAADGLVVRAGAGLPEQAMELHLGDEEALSSRVMRSAEPLVVAPVGGDAELRRTRLWQAAHNSSALIVPIRSGLRPVGTLCAISRAGFAFAEDDVAFMRGLANVVALAAERARVQAQLQLSIDELRKSAEDRSRLLAHLVKAQEDERRRISDDIHDDSVQVMTAVALRLATLRRRLGDEHLDPILLNLEHDVRQSIARLRHLMFVLRPPALENQGIADVLQGYLTQVAEEEGFAYSVEDRLTRELDTETRVVIYRIVQEAVSNVCKHAQASRVEVVLASSAGCVMVEVQDDGMGFDAARVQQVPPGHLGLMVMRERAEQTGGWCVVESAPGHGTTVRFCVGSPELPCPEPSSQPAVGVNR
ncbi:MAG TPA: GAF domain-containing sensor histidine kinase [Candidatus Binatia bacterium]|nr:GAF domain-containing sensor histidine kinase [Candidatus Binatia bacterium]